MTFNRTLTAQPYALFGTGVSSTVAPAFGARGYRRFVHGATGVRYTDGSLFTGVSSTNAAFKCVDLLKNLARKLLKKISSKINNSVVVFGCARGGTA